jgi:hypothetical protein
MTRNAGAKLEIRARMARSGETYQQAAESVAVIHELFDGSDMFASLADAEAWFDNPANKVMCTDCGWTFGMVCPECAKGCGCNNLTCSGWRHREFMSEDEEAVLHECPDCGGDTRNNYACQCA